MLLLVFCVMEISQICQVGFKIDIRNNRCASPLCTTKTGHLRTIGDKMQLLFSSVNFLVSFAAVFSLMPFKFYLSAYPYSLRTLHKLPHDHIIYTILAVTSILIIPKYVSSESWPHVSVTETLLDTCRYLKLSMSTAEDIIYRPC